ncbi:MAG: C39 family peptidase, partial [Candidatus Omnitrophica bacterium]|nr:C39 family peptidase [Candidatus Omnitrophota bacterium]
AEVAARYGTTPEAILQELTFTAPAGHKISITAAMARAIMDVINALPDDIKGKVDVLRLKVTEDSICASVLIDGEAQTIVLYTGDEVKAKAKPVELAAEAAEAGQEVKPDERDDVAEAIAQAEAKLAQNDILGAQRSLGRAEDLLQHKTPEEQERYRGPMAGARNKIQEAAVKSMEAAAQAPAPAAPANAPAVSAFMEGVLEEAADNLILTATTRQQVDAIIEARDILAQPQNLQMIENCASGALYHELTIEGNLVDPRELAIQLAQVLLSDPARRREIIETKNTGSTVMVSAEEMITVAREYYDVPMHLASTDITGIDATLEAGHPVIVWVAIRAGGTNNHFVTVTGMTGKGPGGYYEVVEQDGSVYYVAKDRFVNQAANPGMEFIRVEGNIFVISVESLAGIGTTVKIGKSQMVLGSAEGAAFTQTALPAGMTVSGADIGRIGHVRTGGAVEPQEQKPSEDTVGGEIAKDPLKKMVAAAKTVQEVFDLRDENGKPIVEEVKDPTNEVTLSVSHALLALMGRLRDFIRDLPPGVDNATAANLHNALTKIENILREIGAGKSPIRYFMAEVDPVSGHILGFAKADGIALAANLVDYLRVIGMSAVNKSENMLLEEYVLHEVLESVTTKSQHENLYQKVQRQIYGRENRLGKAMGEFNDILRGKEIVKAPEGLVKRTFNKMIPAMEALGRMIIFISNIAIPLLVVGGLAYMFGVNEEMGKVFLEKALAYYFAVLTTGNILAQLSEMREKGFRRPAGKAMISLLIMAGIFMGLNNIPAMAFGYVIPGAVIENAGYLGEIGYVTKGKWDAKHLDKAERPETGAVSSRHGVFKAIMSAVLIAGLLAKGVAATSGLGLVGEVAPEVGLVLFCIGAIGWAIVSAMDITESRLEKAARKLEEIEREKAALEARMAQAQTMNQPGQEETLAKLQKEIVTSAKFIEQLIKEYEPMVTDKIKDTKSYTDTMTLRSLSHSIMDADKESDRIKKYEIAIDYKKDLKALMDLHLDTAFIKDMKKITYIKPELLMPKFQIFKIKDINIDHIKIADAFKKQSLAQRMIAAVKRGISALWGDERGTVDLRATVIGLARKLMLVVTMLLALVKGDRAELNIEDLSTRPVQLKYEE